MRALTVACLLAAGCLSTSVLAQTVALRDAPEAVMPAQVDSNSPAFWIDGQFHIVNSIGSPIISRGGDQFSMSETQPVALYRRDNYPAWIEAVWVDEFGFIFGWYHQEQHGVCSGTSLALPRIGAAVSYDGGLSFYDLGIVLSSGDPIDCSSANGYFAGGHGDFTVIPDREQNYLYFLFSNYGGRRFSQGVAIARMAIADRFGPVGRVHKYFAGEWRQDGAGGRVTSILPARVSWQRPNTNAFWGPSVHWNTHLETYVMLLNHACCEPGWPQTGIYISYNSDLSNPAGWTRPVRILEDSGWYPQVLGLGPGETDSVAGEVARLYIYGRSYREIIFERPAPPE